MNKSSRNFCVYVFFGYTAPVLVDNIPRDMVNLEIRLNMAKGIKVDAKLMVVLLEIFPPKRERMLY